MRSLYLRIWLTVVAVLALFALVSGWMWHRHVEQERVRFEAVALERLAAWAELVQRALPGADAPAAEQAEALQEWSDRLRVPLALDDRRGTRIAASESFLRREAGGAPRANAVVLDDGRTLWLARRPMRRPPGGGPLSDGVPGGGFGDPGPGPGPGWGWSARGASSAPWQRSARGPMLGEHMPGPALGDRPGMLAPLPALLPLPFGLPSALGPLVLVALLFVAVAAGAYPVVRRLTRRLEALKQGVQAFGRGDLAQRVDASGRDEVAQVAATFNQAAERIEALVRSHQNLLANASHELRSPLARLKMAVAMVDEMPASQRADLKREIDTNVAELDALVEEVLLASRLDASAPLDRSDPVDLAGLLAEEAARFDAEVLAVGDPAALRVSGNERLLRRALRNLLENARRYGGSEIRAEVAVEADGQRRIRVCDRGPGVPAALRERIFEPFFRLPGHAEREGGVGLGLSLVRQIVQAHGGRVVCEAREGGGSCFVIHLPAAAAAGPISAASRPG
ncbi:MAG: HAMP domain-containing protein [Burkholderiaceae bacterium]|nr:HAMP domain-containing protein [Burkholderiaceae bacterium]